MRVPLGDEPDMLLVPDRAIGSDQSGRYLLIAGKDDVVEQRSVEIGQQVGELRVIPSGIKPDDRIVISGLLSAVPGQKIEPQLKTLAATPAAGSRAMISKFFIERPVLANVIAILMVIIGVVSLLVLPVAQYPDVVPPTVSVTTRYPGASARTVIDTVALPIEQQVNGVEDMLYMQSYASADGSYTLTVTFDDRHRPQRRAGAGPEPRVGGAGGAASSGAGARRQRPEEVDGDPRNRDVDVAGRTFRQPLSQQLRDASG